MLNKKYAQIIKLVIDAKGYISANELADNIQTSTKTISRYINSIDNYLKQYNLLLKSKRGIGYKIEGNKKNILNLKNKVEEYIESANLINEKDKIIKNIIILILKQKYITTQDIAIYLNYSIGIINNNINYIKEILKRFNLSLNAKPYYGRYISGDEIDIRNLIESYIIKSNSDLSKYLKGISNKDLKTVEYEVLLYLYQKNIILADKDFDTLINKIIISIWRNKLGYFITLENKTMQNYKIIYDLIKRVSNKINYNINETEIIYISNYFINENDKNDKIISKMLDDAVGDILNIYDKDYRYDIEFLEAIYLHIKSLLTRFKNNTQSVNPIIKDIKTKFAFEFNQAIFLAHKIEETFKIKITEDEIGYLTVHFAASNERNLKVISKNICIICHYGIGTGQLICETLKQNIKNLNVIGVYPARYADIAMKQNVELIVSTVRITSKKVPVLYVDNIFGDDIFERVNNAFYEIEERRKIVENLFVEDSFFKLNVNSKEEALQIVCKTLQNRGLINKNYYDDIIKREKISSTEIGNEVSIPHTIIDGDEKSIIAVILLEKPILWDKSYIKVIFLGLFNTKESYNLSVFKYLYNFIKDEGMVDDIIKYDNFDYFLKRLQCYN